MVWKKLAGAGDWFDSFYPALVIGPNRALYAGVYDGLISIKADYVQQTDPLCAARAPDLLPTIIAAFRPAAKSDWLARSPALAIPEWAASPACRRLNLGRKRVERWPTE